MMGLIAVKTEEMYKQIKLSAVALGCPPGPDDCYLALRGIRTLAVRMKRHEGSGLAVAQWLEARPEVCLALDCVCLSHLLRPPCAPSHRGTPM